IDAALTVPIPTDIQARLTSDDQVIGARMFQEKGCHTCHALGGKGGTRGPDLTTVADRLNEEQITSRIINGADNMPAFAGNISDSELAQLVAFMETLHSPSQIKMPPSGPG